ncbi:MAG: DUF3810 domain-containing protein [Lutispora sp.]|nr:DUF3810 domain-containing protein [Lutispora sp.]
MIWFTILLPISIILVSLAKASPQKVESLFSMGLYKLISQPISRITGFFSISLFEMLFYSFFIFIIIELLHLLKALIVKDGREKILLNLFIRISSVLSILLFLFVTLWGLNYYRMPLSKTAKLSIENSSIKDLEELCNYLIKEANDFRDKIQEDSKGVMKLPQNKQHIISKASKGYINISEEYPVLVGNYGNPKIVLTSRFMSYAGIAGIFSPFTIEANVNGDVPDATFPSAIVHEMAHQRGYAREDEANFISFLACSANPDIEYKYSGTLLALIHSMNALYKIDIDKALELAKQYSPALKRDLAAINAYWEEYEGPVERTSTKLNNTYLKANDQKDGVNSYGRMVDLLLSYYKLKILH